jgi:addiction module RelE/StbE family toxin
MWRIDEHRRVDKQLSALRQEVLKPYEKWKDIAMLSAPPGLRLIKGFQDEALSGERKGHRSSRLGVQYRIIYRTMHEEQLFQVVSITAHNHRKPE